jgi:lycopene beta-cyclase
MYVLPLAPQRVLVEDTYVSRSETLDEAQVTNEIMAYAERIGLRVRAVLRRERGVLPMPSRGVLPRADKSPIVAGYRGGYFHPVTGYSLPMAVRFAEALSRTDPHCLTDSPLDRFARHHTQQLGFLFGMTGILFSWFAPSRRFLALEHFYRLPEELIERFYAAQLTPLDRVRIFWGPLPRGLCWKRVLGFKAGEHHELARLA